MEPPVKKLVAGLLAVLLLATPAAALTQDEATAWARWTGCKAEVTVVTDTNFIMAYYSPWDPAVVLWGLSGFDESIQLGILLHELAHCIQHQTGRLYGRDIVDIEWEADAMGLDWGCAIGNPPSWFAAFLQWAKEALDYDGDPDHGSAADRLAHADAAATRCKAVPTQAP